jgi:hypothetical protein
MDLEQLNNILSKGEGQHTEFKSDFPEQAHKIAKSMVAFSNSGGGIILMGVDDDGSPVGIGNPSDAVDRLADIAKGCNPPLWPTIGRTYIRSNVTVVYAELSHSPISMYGGKVYIRVGATSREASGKEIEKLSQPLNPQHIQLEANLEQSYRISRRKLKNRAWKGYFISTVGIILYLGLTFGLLLTKPDIVFSMWHTIILVAIMASFIYILKPYLDDMSLYYKRPKKVNQSIFVGQGRFIEEKDEDSYLVYKPTAACIYPCCNQGKIVVTNAPPREASRLGKTYVGICSIAGKDHSYRIDHIWVATPESFDWRALDRT